MGGKAVLFALVYLGFTAGLPGRLNVELGLFSLQLAVALAVGWIGWQGLKTWPALRSYRRFALALSVWTCVSSIAAWDTSALYWSATTAIWLLFIVPGVANLLRHETNRKALIVGIFGAALAYAFTGLGRLAIGREVFDMPNPDRGLLLGVKRGLVNARLVYVVPFFVANAPPLARRLRWVGAAAAVAGIIVSGGRAGLVALAVVCLTYAVMRPGTSQKLKALLTAALLGLVLVTAIGEFGGQAVVGKNRLVSYIRGERTSGDEKREAWLKRAWHVGLKNPAFGIGYGNVEGTPDEALDEIRNRQGRQRAVDVGVHNTYAQVFAEFGVPGALAFVLLLLSLLRRGWAERARPEVLAATSGLVGLMLVMVFNPIALSFVYFPLAYLVGALGEPDRATHDRVAVDGVPRGTP
jgi:O-antigen ligase